MVRYIRRSGCLQKEQLGRELEAAEQWALNHSHTVDVDLALLHKLPKPGKAFSGVYCLHALIWRYINTRLRARIPRATYLLLPHLSYSECRFAVSEVEID